jgi:hypothetical protein
MNEQEKAQIHEEVKADILEKEQADKKKDKWLNYLSISTILIALCATLSSYNGGNAGGNSTMSQIKASDLWAQYQSKSIKQYLYEIQIDNLNTSLLTIPAGAAYDSIKKHINGYNQNIAKYKTDKEEISKNAKHLEAVRDESSKHGGAFGLAVLFLEISILLSSIAALIKKKLLWYISMLPGLVGIIYFINGFLLFF